uniref:HTH psq-type domain-containing protein n=1 Tax=Timema poppense TaxID=170557 RepID=A0A7R9DKB5_TIMPO|nr:unnamed protein product [Timema poppensis]
MAKSRLSEGSNQNYHHSLKSTAQRYNMSRNYIKKKPPPPYIVETLQTAVADVENSNKALREAAAFYGIPATTIYYRIEGIKSSRDASTESLLVECLIARSKLGYPCDKEELLDLVQEFVVNNTIKTPFVNNRPGHDWYSGFMKRHLTAYDEHEMKDKVNFIFNCDESGFPSDPSKLRALGEMGKPLNRISGGSGKENTTVLACVSAAGVALPPLIVFKVDNNGPSSIVDDKIVNFGILAQPLYRSFVSIKGRWETEIHARWFLFQPPEVRYVVIPCLQSYTAHNSPVENGAPGRLVDTSNLTYPTRRISSSGVDQSCRWFFFQPPEVSRDPCQPPKKSGRKWSLAPTSCINTVPLLEVRDVTEPQAGPSDITTARPPQRQRSNDVCPWEDE